MNKVKFILIIFLIVLVYFIISYIMYQRIFYINDKNFKLTNLNKKKILIYTIETRDLKLIKIHNDNINNYAQKHNYMYYFFDDYKNDLKLPIYWWKIQSMLELFNNSDFDYVLWLDSDAFVVDDDIPLEALIELSPESSIFIGTDYPDYPQHLFSTLFLTTEYCAGVFLIKNDEIGRNFLEDCIKRYINRKPCKVNNEFILNSGWGGQCYEQGIMNELLKTKYKENVFKIPYSFVLNNYKVSKYTVISHIFGGDKENTYNEIKKII